MTWLASLFDREKAAARLTSLPFIGILYVAIGVVAPVLKYLDGNENNIRIFFASVRHLTLEQDLYAPYPVEHADYFLYGPVFCLFVAPFAYLPSLLGVIGFSLAMTACFVGAVYSLKISATEKAVICLICCVDYLTNSQNFQTNGLVAATVLFGLGAIQRDRPVLAGLCIAFGIFMKVYGIVGLSLFFFTDRKLRFALAVMAGSAFCFFAPMLLSSWQFIIDSYPSWFRRLGAENETNTQIVSGVGYQSIFDTIRRCFGYQLPVLPVLVGVAAAFAAAVFYRPLTKSPNGAMRIIAAALIGLILFSTGSENPTYIILMTGVALWFVLHWKSAPRLAWLGLAAVFVFSSLAPTEVYNHAAGDWYDRHALRAVPGFALWCFAMVELWRPVGDRHDSETVES
ncbi:MAG: glycosyltransferase family 87 protein [Verrucomicrobiota bacterium]